MNLELNKIHLGDSRELIRKIPNEYIDLIVSDVPYGIGYQSNLRKNKFDVIAGDTEPDLEILSEFYRVLKPNSACYIFTSWGVYPMWHEAISKHFDVKNMCIW